MSKLDKGIFSKLVIPVKKVGFTEDAFRWPDKPVLVSERIMDMLPLLQLRNDLKQRLAVHAPIIFNAFGPADVRIHRDPAIKHKEAYRIAITPNGVEIAAGTDAGAYYAVQTVRDLIALYGRKLPVSRIEDEPLFERRGVYHDCSRGKVPTLETLKQLVERLAHWKINEFQLYIENVFTFVRHPDIGRGFSPLTPDEILALQEHCKKHHVRLVGSLASFGHCEKILALPAYRHLGEMPGFRNLPGGTTLCPTDPGSIKLIGKLYEEFIPLFEAEDFNVCCDETWELGKGRSQKQAQKNSIGRLYLDFLLKIHRLCQKHGKRMNCWADILLKYPDLLNQLPRDIVLLNWEYEHDGANIRRTKEIANAGLDFMVCPGTSGWLTHGSRIPNSIQNVAAFARQGQRYGASGLLNTDWGDQGHRNFLGVSLHGFAHGAAHAWNTKAVDDQTFTENFCRQLFGDPAKPLAKALTILGSTYLTCGSPRRNGSYLFEALTEPMLPSNPSEYSAIEKMTTGRLEKVIHQLSAENFWPTISFPLPEFERIAIEELKLAARMDCLAAERALASKTLRRGDKIAPSQIRRLAGQMETISKEFQRLWLKRNKLSCLRDNLRLFKKTQRQMLCLIKK